MSTFFGRWLTRKKRGKFSLVGVCLYIVDPKNKSTFSTHPVGEGLYPRLFGVSN